jgi:hypothetical protein
MPADDFKEKQRVSYPAYPTVFHARIDPRRSPFARIATSSSHRTSRQPPVDPDITLYTVAHRATMERVSANSLRAFLLICVAALVCATPVVKAADGASPIATFERFGVWRGTVGHAKVMVCLEPEDNDASNHYYLAHRIGIPLHPQNRHGSAWTETPPRTIWSTPSIHQSQLSTTWLCRVPRTRSVPPGESVTTPNAKAAAGGKVPRPAG